MHDVVENKHAQIVTRSSPGPEVVIGILAGFDETGTPLVEWPGSPKHGPAPALSAASCSPSDIGVAAALLFSDGDPTRPVIVGFLRQHLDQVISATTDTIGRDGPVDDAGQPSGKNDAPTQELEARVDGKRIVISGEREIVLQCGKASITLTKSGKVLIRGEYLSSRSSGTNHIKGGAIHLN